ncbi:MAG: ribosomal L7Ae/L30e/S12e/Gadd45 family protein [Clostridia bacterium]|nr:ribosomal L7Ae/L30e/S12e/Gadd45 family protein [Clostridia bacterium]
MLLNLKDQAKTVGLKQSQRAIREGRAQQVFLADDADGRIRQELEQLCVLAGIPVTPVASMEELGRACGIRVGAAVAVVLKT